MIQIKKHNELIFLLVISTVFLFLASQNITLPGLQDDEGAESTAAMNFFYGDEKLFYYIGLYGKSLFVMINPYTGPIEAYSVIPFYYILGVSVHSIRIAKVFYGLIEIILFFYFAKEFFNKKLAYIATSLFATMPTFIFYSRQGIVANHMILLPLLLSFIFFLKFFKKRNIAYFYLSCFFFGVGFTTKITFWWLIPPMLLSIYIFKVKLKINSWQRFIGLIFFCLGAAPIILYNIASRGGTIRYVLTQSPAININVFSNLILRFKQLIILLNGELDNLSLGGHFSTHCSVIFIIASIFLFFYALQNLKQEKKILFVLFLIITILLESIFTVSKLLEVNLFMLLPLCLLIVSYFLYTLLDKKKVIFFILFLLIIFSNMFYVISYHNLLRKTGGVAQMSDAIYELAEYLEEKGINRPLAVDWGFNFNIRILTNNKVKPFGIFVYPDKTGNYLYIFKKTCINEFKNPNSIYIFTAPPYTVYERFDDFKRIAEDMNKRVVLEKTFYQRNGEPIYLLYRILGK